MVQQETIDIQETGHIDVLTFISVAYNEGGVFETWIQLFQPTIKHDSHII